MKIYLAGKVTGNPNYTMEFTSADLIYSGEGHSVLNPAALPEGMETADYMRICLPMLLSADCVVLLPTWKDSPGAKIEKSLAEYVGIDVLFAENDQRFMKLWRNIAHA